MPNILNPGNIITVYPVAEAQMVNQCGCEESSWVIPLNSPPTVQFPVPSFTLNDWTWEIWEDGAMFSAMAANRLDYIQEGVTDNAWVQFKGDGAWPEVPNRCKPQHLRFYRDGELYAVSERFQIIQTNDPRKVYRLDFSNTKDLDGVVYQVGYSQHVLLLEAVFDTPEVNEPIETETDGNAVEYVTFQSIQRREVLRFPFYPDFWQGLFERLKMHDNVKLTKVATGEIYTLNGKDIAFESEVQDDCFSIGALSWRESNMVTTGCEKYLSGLIVNGETIPEPTDQ